MSRVGVIGDTHEPFVHPMYRRFVCDTFSKWNVNQHVFIGDIVDSHALSFWEHNPNGRSAEDEAQEAAIGVARWVKTFSKAVACVGNHDARHFRVARKHGLPDRYLKTYNEVWGTPGWDWQFSHKIDGVIYEHGTGASGKNGAINRAMERRSKIVIGHIHSWAGVNFHANEDNMIWGMNVGCGIDCRRYAFEYGKDFTVRPVLGCGIVIDGDPFFIPMPCKRGQKYHRSRAKRKR